MKTIIFANGKIESLDLLKELVQENDTLIAADGGLKHIRAIGKVPDLLVGDLDSVEKKDLKWLEERGVEVRRFPEKKDQTDLELAILDAVDHGAERLVIAGGLGGRIDQTLANINLLLIPEIQNIDVRIDDGMEELFLITRHAFIHGEKGDVVSLLPLNRPAIGVVTKGLSYKLKGETLFPEQSRGISNVMKKGIAEVSLESGVILCVHTRSQKQKG
ncbi:MAG: thiamine diphosphokinase [Chloroflexi bacterium]|nr:thiamine diphosphokinase [Chloroflexota bacterium]